MRTSRSGGNYAKGKETRTRNEARGKETRRGKEMRK